MCAYGAAHVHHTHNTQHANGHACNRTLHSPLQSRRGWLRVIIPCCPWTEHLVATASRWAKSQDNEAGRNAQDRSSACRHHAVQALSISDVMQRRSAVKNCNVSPCMMSALAISGDCSCWSHPSNITDCVGHSLPQVTALQYIEYSSDRRDGHYHNINQFTVAQKLLEHTALEPTGRTGNHSHHHSAGGLSSSNWPLSSLVVAA